MLQSEQTGSRTWGIPAHSPILPDAPCKERGPPAAAGAVTAGPWLTLIQRLKVRGSRVGTFNKY